MGRGGNMNMIHVNFSLPGTVKTNGPVNNIKSKRVRGRVLLPPLKSLVTVKKKLTRAEPNNITKLMTNANKIVQNVLNSKTPKTNRVVANTSKNIPRQQVNNRSVRQKLLNTGPTNNQRKLVTKNLVKNYINIFNKNVNNWVSKHKYQNNISNTELKNFIKDVTLKIQKYQTENIPKISNKQTENRQKMLNSMRNQTFLKRLIAQMIYNQ